MIMNCLYVIYKFIRFFRFPPLACLTDVWNTTVKNLALQSRISMELNFMSSNLCVCLRVLRIFYFTTLFVESRLEAWVNLVTLGAVFKAWTAPWATHPNSFSSRQVRKRFFNLSQILCRCKNLSTQLVARLDKNGLLVEFQSEMKILMNVPMTFGKSTPAFLRNLKEKYFSKEFSFLNYFPMNFKSIKFYKTIHASSTEKWID